MQGVRPLALAAAAAAAVAVLTGCASSQPVAFDSSPDAIPLTKNLNDAANAEPPFAPVTSDRSQSRVLAYVNGGVVSYRDVMLQAPPQLDKMEGAERDNLERRTLYDILQDRILERAAIDAGIDISRDELDRQRTRRTRDLEKTGATLDAYLRERGQSRREFDEEIRREHRIGRYLGAAVGRGQDPSVRVRAITDTFVSPREMRAYYDRNVEKFHEQETGRVRVLLIQADRSRDDREAAIAEAKAKAQAVFARLKAGEDWVPIYRELCPLTGEPDTNDVIAMSRVNDGLIEIPAAKRGSALAPWIEKCAFEGTRGVCELRLPEEGKTQFFILRAEGHDTARVRPYEEVQTIIQKALSQMRYAVASYEVVLSLLEESAITPRARYDELRSYLTSTRRALVVEAGL